MFILYANVMFISFVYLISFPIYINKFYLFFIAFGFNLYIHVVFIKFSLFIKYTCLIILHIDIMFISFVSIFFYISNLSLILNIEFTYLSYELFTTKGIKARSECDRPPLATSCYQPTTVAVIFKKKKLQQHGQKRPDPTALDMS